MQGFGALEGMNGVQKFQIHRDDRSTDRWMISKSLINESSQYCPGYPRLTLASTSWTYQLTRWIQWCFIVWQPITITLFRPTTNWGVICWKQFRSVQKALDSHNFLQPSELNPKPPGNSRNPQSENKPTFRILKHYITYNCVILVLASFLTRWWCKLKLL